ncbi:MAG TPA: 2Fe-2S iron-sulfur cluster-binding protein [Burkholderiaceae bacterium]|nr:2Fe-2S iron-sulfur cluster-binding protein [Burkholderiaceae bacterium]
MPDFFINGQPVTAAKGQTVMQAAKAAGFFIPGFCWHPQLSVAGNCRICVVEVEGEGGGGSWMEIACNMPVTEGMRVLTDSEAVRARRRETLQFILLNHPVDCGVCDKAGECMLQDYHYEMNGLPSISTVPKVHATKYHELSSRIVLDNERCIVCSRCVRFTREISKSHALGIQNRGDGSLVRAAEGRSLDDDPYSDNVVDICPVGALLSKQFLHKARVWYLKATPSVCPGCSRGCNVDFWHRRSEWKLNALDPRENTAIARVTPRENPAVNGPWICNKGRDIAQLLERPRAEQAMLNGAPATLDDAIAIARSLVRKAQRPVALVSSWGSNEELAALKAALGDRFEYVIKSDCQAVPGEVVEDDLLIRADKNPNLKMAQQVFGDGPHLVPQDADLVLVWGEGASFAALPRGVKTIFLGSYLAPENGLVDVFIPVSIMTERAGHYTNFAGVVSAFEPIVRKKAGVAHAEQLFAQLAATAEAIA